MTNIVVMKDDCGKLTGFSEKDKRAYHRFKKQLDELVPGELFTLEVWFPREGWRHRKHFAMLATIYDAQEQFADVDQLRMWLQVGAGHCEFVPGPTGRMVAIPKSISWSKMDDAEFTEHHRKVVDFLRSEHAQRFLWPHLTPEQTWQTIETILEEFERQGA